jgi:hypothetical protein
MRSTTGRAPRGGLILLLAGLGFSACGFHTNGDVPPGAGGGGTSSTSSTSSSSSSSGAACTGKDSDGDGVPDLCDVCAKGDDKVDTDHDGVPDACDICDKGDDKIDTDHDGVPDACDICDKGDDKVDTDHDGVPDACDVCDKGDDKIDTDHDGVPDACDVCDKGDDKIDTDHDGVPDACDVCPNGDDKLDVDGDGLPDACDLCPYDGPTAPTVPNSYAETSTSGSKTTSLGITNFKFDGSGTNVLVVSPGETFAGTYTVTISDCICTGCNDQINIGPLPGGPVSCGPIYNPGCSQYAPDSSASFKAPSTPGAYAIGFKLAQDDYCFKSGSGWFGGAPAPASTVAYICVQ